MENTAYIRLHHRVLVQPNQKIYLHDIAQIIVDPEVKEPLSKLIIYEASESDRNIIIIDVIQVVQEISRHFPKLGIEMLGPTQTIVEVVYKKKKYSLPLFFITWLLLFFGAALTIMNFHEDVGMEAVHQKIYEIMTGRKNEKPLLFQIPYSIGLGVGMILFFNHVFKKRLNEEPSPLEVEMFNYQQDLDQYVIMHENKESMKKIDGH
ncbi:stage V sporulation protein AA [Bacillus benzoevorans]|uniref:Stage V sporulation protein AA n=1 Tax=Bacillus benzoevorans TaxID=1456 RepID=A0A7X0LUA2_9BACI|nr:stage V sporulation protein AA [Bacillus benzoevorans]MBB6444761.1 stage V sporulation protein AA [Bacillus benzoevorans]